MKSIRLLLLLASGVTTGAFAQSGGLTDMSQSRFAKMANTELGAVHWTDGFWGDRFNVYSHTSLQSMWDTWNNPDVSHGFRNFEIAAGVCEGEHWGPPFHDGDMYKWMEGVASVYAVTKDPELDKLMDHFIEHVVKAQRADGYIHTPVIIEEKNKGIDTHSDKQQTFSNFLNTNQSCRKRKWEGRRRQKPFFIICPARGPKSICRRRLSNCAPHRRGQEARRQRRTPGREAPRSGLCSSVSPPRPSRP